MDKDKLRELLDNIYEIEALVQLALMRDDCSEQLLKLIEKKVKTFCNNEIQKPCYSEIELQIPEESDTLELSENDSEKLSEKEEILPEYENHDDDVIGEYALDSEESAESSEIEAESVPPADEKEPEGSNDEEDVFPEDDNEIPLKKQRSRASATPRGRLVFSINDRYRFKRELFNNSDVEFNTTLAFVASMESYDEAEEYFIGELGLDENNPAVIDFLGVLWKYFN